jgi:chaperonin GroEL
MTEIEMKERKDRVDDALHATRAAAKEGYVPGGGVAFIRALDAVEAAQKKAKGDEKFGYDIVAEALTSCCAQIAKNAGFDGDLVVEKVRDGGKTPGFGFNAASGQYEDLVKSGIIDPALVAKTALTNAASVAGLMLTTDVIITELKEDAKPVEGSVN